jgi:predicted nucleotidyltransferase
MRLRQDRGDAAGPRSVIESNPETDSEFDRDAAPNASHTAMTGALNALIKSFLDDPILVHFRHALDAAYGTRVERVVLYGSRARGDSRPDSDYDLAVFLRDMPDRARELNRLADIATDVLYDIGGVVHAMPYPAGAYNERTPLMHEIRTDGVDL